METTFISAEEAGAILKKSRRRINQLIAAGELRGRLIGNSNVVSKSSVLALKKRRKTRRANGKKKG